jgi:L-alanine-DL-glutamate epimerase-like enolase superfamily enzyme
MKITGVETIVLNLPMVIDGATPTLGGRARTSIDMLLVRVETDAGITGWGEAFGHRVFPATRAALDTLLGPMCVGRDASAIGALTDELQRVLHGVGRGGASPRCRPRVWWSGSTATSPPTPWGRPSIPARAASRCPRGPVSASTRIQG